MTGRHSARAKRKRRQVSIRLKVEGTAARPRLRVFRSLNHIYAQVIEDDRSHTVAASSTLDPQIKVEAQGKTKSEAARLAGTLVAQRALERGVTKVVFDRGGYKYHGRVKALADAAREAGLVF